jgi:hypothetical protein
MARDGWKPGQKLPEDDPVQLLMEVLLSGSKPRVSYLFREQLSQAVLSHSRGDFGDPLDVQGMVRFTIEICALLDDEIDRHRESWVRAYQHMRDGKLLPFESPV